MSQVDPQLMSRWFQRVWKEEDRGAIAEMLASDAPVHGIGEEPLQGVAGFEEFHAQMLAAFCEIDLRVVDQVFDGDRVALRVAGTMRHRKSGKVVPLEGMGMATVQDGRMVEAWNTMNFLPLLIDLEKLAPSALEEALGATGSPS